MNITLYTHEAFARYILCCVIFGFCTFIFHCIICVIISIPMICKCNNTVMLKAYIGALSKSEAKISFLSDFLGVIMISTSLLAVSFISNSGEFRIMSILLLIGGFGLGALLLKKIIIVVISYLCFAVKKIVLWISAPIVFLIRVALRVVIRVCSTIKKRCHAAQIAKYTKKKYEDLDIIKQTGLLDHLFEVV